MNSTTKRLAQLHFFVQNDPWLAICTVAQCLTRSSRNRSLVASVCLLTSLAAGLEMGLDGVCVKTFFLLWHKDIFATLWGDILLHLHTNMMSRYHIFSWRYHDHDNDEK